MVKEHCGVFGAYNFNGEPVFQLLYWALISQNHRGHESHGFLTYDRGFHLQRNVGLVPEIKVKDVDKWMKKLPGNIGIGGVRYGTSGYADEASLLKDAHPFVAKIKDTEIGISYNGNIVNNPQLRRMLSRTVGDLGSTSDISLISTVLLRELVDKGDLFSSAERCMEEVEGAFSLVGLTDKGELFSLRDPYGIRPLSCGFNEDRTCFAVSSETVGLNINNILYDSEIKPGELVIVTEDGVERKQVVKSQRRALCSFEFAYFARPDSFLNGTKRAVYEVREMFGRNLGRVYADIAKKCDLIISIPETANDAAYGLHEETGLRWERSLRRHRYITHRAFITPSKEARHKIISRKVNITDHKMKGKKVIVVEDSIVRGDTTKTIIRKLREAGAEEVHLFVTFPRIIGPCFYGIDMATYQELIGSSHEPEEIAKIIGADSVNYQPIADFVKAIGLRRDELCLGCITGEYPTPTAQEIADKMRSLFEQGVKEKGRIYETYLQAYFQ